MDVLSAIVISKMELKLTNQAALNSDDIRGSLQFPSPNSPRQIEMTSAAASTKTPKGGACKHCNRTKLTSWPSMSVVQRARYPIGPSAD